MGPSGPTGNPDATAQTHEKNFTAIVFTSKIWRMIVPFRKPISSGIPDPAADGRKNYKRKNIFL
jgi:hypothetical protein